MIARLARLSTEEVHAGSAAIAQRLAALPELPAATWVAGFVSFGTEVHTHGLLRGLLAAGQRVCVPSFDPVGQRYICSELKHFEADLTPGKLGILEPKRAALRPVHADQLEAWLLPGLAFDEEGNRLGRGMGYYDQLLRDARGVKIALAYDFQVVQQVPSLAHDVGMDWIVTATRTIRCLRKRP